MIGIKAPIIIVVMMMGPSLLNHIELKSEYLPLKIWLRKGTELSVILKLERRTRRPELKN
jgi:hypothetical protein